MNHKKNYLATGRTIPKGWHIHHIVPRCEGGTDEASNLICVHPNMHKWVHEQRGDKRAATGAYIMRNGHSAETRAKMSATRKGRKHSDETKAKMSASHMGKKFSLETRANISAVRTGTKHSEATKIKLSASLTGRKLSEEHKASLRRASLKRNKGK